jgi:hypothetical protein
MRASFERGDASAPRGHALVYVRDSYDPAVIRASYLIVAPIEMDFAKYIPPMFAGQLAGMMPSGPAALPLPPIPEPVESLAWLERLAEARDDDLLDGGRVDCSSPQQLMMLMAELAGEYATLWTQRAAQLNRPPEQASAAEPAALPDVEDLLVSVMTDSEKVGRLAKLAGNLRYAVEVSDAYLDGEVSVQIERVGRHLPDSYRVADLLAAARQSGPTGARLLSLHVERCYKLAAGEYADLERLDREIAAVTDD